MPPPSSFLVLCLSVLPRQGGFAAVAQAIGRRALLLAKGAPPVSHREPVSSVLQPLPPRKPSSQLLDPDPRPMGLWFSHPLQYRPPMLGEASLAVYRIRSRAEPNTWTCPPTRTKGPTPEVGYLPSAHPAGKVWHGPTTKIQPTLGTASETRSPAFYAIVPGHSRPRALPPRRAGSAESRGRQRPVRGEPSSTSAWVTWASWC